jgi:hypothetical protein
MYKPTCKLTGSLISVLFGARQPNIITRWPEQQLRKNRAPHPTASDVPLMIPTISRIRFQKLKGILKRKRFIEKRERIKFFLK